MPTCAFIESPEGMESGGALWDQFAKRVQAVRPDILVMNEMPFGPWLASASQYDGPMAERSIALHDAGTEALVALGVPAVVSSRPVAHNGRLVNEAIAIENGRVRALHRKQYFPDEPGRHEADWFVADRSGFAVHSVGELKIGVLLCTGLMFNEHARGYGRAGADLIVVPRAAGTAHSRSKTAASMAAIVSGSFVVSSNRVGNASPRPTFGGCGYAFGPRGDLISETSAAEQLIVASIDVKEAERQKQEYAMSWSDIWRRQEVY